MSKANVRDTVVLMPQFAESVVEGTIGQWLKQPGDQVVEYDVLCEVITDKVTAELPSTAAGILKEILVEAGATVEVGKPICVIEESGDGVGSSAGLGATGDSANEPAGAPGLGASASETVGAIAAVSSDQSMRGRLSPAVRTLADEHGIDLAYVQGTGLGGRITRKDVLAFIESGGATGQPQSKSSVSGHVSQAQSTEYAAPVEKPLNIPVRSSGLHLSESPRIPTVEVDVGSGAGEHFIDVTPIRQTIATRMRQSVSEIPHAWTMIEVDVTNLVLLRNKLKDEFKRQEGVNLTYLAFLLKAVVNAIKDYPIMNSVWAVDKIIVKRDINVSLAVGTEDSVLTPVIKRADQMNIAGLAREIEELAVKTRMGKLSPADMQGGTFTVNNTGSFGSILSYPIINYPQAAILTFESIVKKPVVIHDMIAVRSMVNLCLSLDHRILDGVICGRFLQRVKENLESYGPDTKLY